MKFCGKSTRSEWGNVSTLYSHPEGIQTRQQRCSRRGTSWLGVECVKDDSISCQLLQCRSDHLRIVPGHIIVTKVVCDQNQYVWRFCCCCCRYEDTRQNSCKSHSFTLTKKFETSPEARIENKSNISHLL